MKKAVQEKTELLCKKGHSIIKLEGELRKPLVQLPSALVLAIRKKTGYSGLYPGGTCLPWNQGKMLTDFNKTEISAEASNSVI